MRSFKFISLLTTIAICLSGCGQRQTQTRTTPQPGVTSVEIVNVTPTKSAGRSDQDTSAGTSEPDLIINVLVNNEPIRVLLGREKFERNQQFYSGRYFANLDSKCLAPNCSTLAVGLTFMLSGGSSTEVFKYQQVFFKVQLPGAQLTDLRKHGGNDRREDHSSATLEDYLAGRV